jgi:heptosyltransferase-2
MKAFCTLLSVNEPPALVPQFAAPIWEDRGLKAARRQIAALRRPVLAVCAAAAEPIRQREYPLNMMAVALEALLARGTIGSAILVGDAASRRRIDRLTSFAGPRALNLAGNLSVSATTAIMQECDAVLAVDGGLLHMALCTDLPIVALYGPTEIFTSDPRGLWGRYDAISAFERCHCRCLPHRGLRARPECCELAQCLSTIPPERVVHAVEAILSACAIPEHRVTDGRPSYTQ